MKFLPDSPKRELEKEVVRIKEDLGELKVGSEEYLNACKAENQLAEAAGKLRKVDLNTLITGGVSITMFVIYMCFSETHISDTRGIQFVKGLFKR